MHNYEEFERIHGCSEFELTLPIWCDIYDATLAYDERKKEEARQAWLVECERIKRDWEEKWKKRIQKSNGSTWEQWWAECKRVADEELKWGSDHLSESHYRAEYEKDNLPDLALLDNY